MSAREQIRVSREWLDLVKQLPDAGRVLVIGATDSGKTTLCRWLLSKIPANTRPVLVDADLGQTQIGPPGCVAWRFAGETAYRFFFVGDTTPATAPTVALAALHRAVTGAEAAGAGLTLVDTSGYLDGRGGFELKSAKLDVLAPAHVILIGDNPQTKRLLAAWHQDDRLTIHRLSQSDSIQQKSRPERTEWRQKKWAAQFSGLDLRRVTLKGKCLSGLPTAAELKTRNLTLQDLPGLLLGFTDRHRHGLCLGLLQSLDLPALEMVVRAPPEAETASGIMFGLLKIAADGQELGRIV
jgi:polynucleotide 5'-hydroxyl-kinase GRC3/NOL9